MQRILNPTSVHRDSLGQAVGRAERRSFRPIGTNRLNALAILRINPDRP